MRPFPGRAYLSQTTADSWEELWEAATYYDRVATLLEEASRYAIFVGWQVDSRVRLQPGNPETLREKVVRLCEKKRRFHVYFLMWDHAYFYCLERETLQGRVWDGVHPRVHFVFDNRHPIGGSHHEKIVIIDGRVVLCGGIDICDERWDSPDHRYHDPRRSLTWSSEHHGPYHDVGVQVTGAVCADIQRHVAHRWRRISTIPFPDPEEPPNKGALGVYFSRTLALTDSFPIVREIEFMLGELIRRARHRIILEGQYYWSERMNDLLISKIRQMAGTPFELHLILADLSRHKSLTRQMASHQLQLLERLEAAAAESGIRLSVGTPWVFPGATETRDHMRAPKAVYVHSKVMLIDDRYLCIGSANLASRALRVDTEVSLTFEATREADQRHIRRVGERILDHWNFGNDANRPMLLRPLDARKELLRLPGWKHFPWKHFIDPLVPWSFRFRRTYHRLTRYTTRRTRYAKIRSYLIPLTMTFLLMVGACATLGLTAVLGPPSSVSVPWLGVFAYGAALSSFWILPLPFFPLALLISIHLGNEIGPMLAVSSFWVGALWGYGLARTFPNEAGRFYRRTAPRGSFFMLDMPTRIGVRSFPYLLSLLVDPRVSIRSKIAYQGLYCVPTPWLGLGTFLFLGSALFLSCQWINEIISGQVRDSISWLAPPLTALILLSALLRLLLIRP